MNKYTQFLNKNWQLLSALQWFWFKRKGLGVLCLKENRVYFVYNNLDERIKRLCDRNPPQFHVIVRFDDGAVMVFQPPELPQKCYERLKPQLGDFIALEFRGI